MQFLLGKKEKMTQIFGKGGEVHPSTVLYAPSVTVTAVRTIEKDGYSAIQVGFGTKAERKINKAEMGHLKGKGPFEHLVEFRMKNDAPADVNVGDVLTLADMLKEGDVVTVSATTKGKGFQGVVKRHGFSGHPSSHGRAHDFRTPGSIGAKGPAKVFKGRKMPGRMGSDRVTVKNLTVVAIDSEAGKLYLKGAVPGRPGTLVEIRKTS